jgi:hypothetical protein
LTAPPLTPVPTSTPLLQRWTTCRDAAFPRKLGITKTQAPSVRRRRDGRKTGTLEQAEARAFSHVESSVRTASPCPRAGFGAPMICVPPEAQMFLGVHAPGQDGWQAVSRPASVHADTSGGRRWVFAKIPFTVVQTSPDANIELTVDPTREEFSFPFCRVRRWRNIVSHLCGALLRCISATHRASCRDDKITT